MLGYCPGTTKGSPVVTVPLPLVLSSKVGAVVCALGMGHLARANSGMGTLLHNGGMGGCCMAEGGPPKGVMCPIS